MEAVLAVRVLAVFTVHWIVVDPYPTVMASSVRILPQDSVAGELVSNRLLYRYILASVLLLDISSHIDLSAVLTEQHLQHLVSTVAYRARPLVEPSYVAACETAAFADLITVRA